MAFQSLQNCLESRPLTKARLLKHDLHFHGINTELELFSMPFVGIPFGPFQLEGTNLLGGQTKPKHRLSLISADPYRLSLLLENIAFRQPGVNLQIV